VEKWLQEKVYDTAERLLSITAEEALRKVRVSEQRGGIPSMLPSLLQRMIMIESEHYCQYTITNDHLFTEHAVQ